MGLLFMCIGASTGFCNSTVVDPTQRSQAIVLGYSPSQTSRVTYFEPLLPGRRLFGQSGGGGGGQRDDVCGTSCCGAAFWGAEEESFSGDTVLVGRRWQRWGGSSCGQRRRGSRSRGCYI